MSYTNKYLPGIELQTPQEVAAYIAAHPGDERARWWKVVPAPGNALGLTTDDIPEGIVNLYYNPSRVSKEIADAVASLEIPEASDDLPQPLGAAAAGVAAEYSRGDHVHEMPDASDVGAEPYAGVPAQTSFWRSTAAGVRAWVQLVAADITDLATTLAAYLTKANPTYTGTLTGPRATLAEFGKFQSLVGDTAAAAIYGTGVTPSTTNYALRFNDSGTGAILNASTAVSLAIGATSKAYVTTDAVDLGSGVALKMAATTVIDASRNGTFKSLASEENVFLPNSVVWKSGATNYFSMYATSIEFGIRDLNDAGSVIAYPLIVKRGVGGEIQIGYSGGLRPVRIGGAIKNDNLAGPGNRPLVAGADGTIDDQGAATFRGTIGALAADNPDFTGALKQGGTTRITSGGGAWLTSVQSASLVGAGDRPVAADLTGTLQPKTPDQFRNMIFALASSLKGSANGVAELGADVKVPVAQLPSAALLALGADSTTAHRGDHGTTAYTHSQIATGNPHGTTAADVGAMAAANPVFTGTLKQGGATLIDAVGGAQFSSVAATGDVEASSFVAVNGAVFGTLADSGDVFVAATNDGVIYSRTPSQARALMGAAKAPSKVDISASTTLGSIDATAIKVTTTDVILTLSGGTDGTSWDIINPTASTGIAIPSGATLWKSIGSDVGPTTIALGGGRPIRITRIDANTWTMLGSQ